MMTARGLRNKNPGNIRHNATFHWQGEIGADDQNFIIFDTEVNGIRALARDLQNKIRRGLDTVEKILTVYAPPSENNTDAYIASVCKQTGFNPDEQINVTIGNLAKLVKAIITHECGEQPFSEGLIDEGVKSALNIPV
jgi:hypothetical protein